MKSNGKTKFIIILLLLLISIGFAYLSTNLSISGIGKFKPNTWDVHFENVVVDLDNTEENSTASISSDRHTVNFDISLNEPGSSYSLYVDVVNAGTIDAMFDDFIVQGVPDNLQNIISLEYSYNDNGIISKYDLLPKKSSQKIRVIVNYLDPEDETFLPQEDGSLCFSLQLNYLQADEKAITRIKKDSAADKIITLAKSDASIVEDTTDDRNLRYVGANPNNYVSFNGELWRIIGVFNNTLDKYGTKTSRVKIVRQQAIGSYSYDSSVSSINQGYGTNNWGTSKIVELLNDKFYNSKNTFCYVFNGSLATNPCDFTDMGLKNDSKKYIENAVWDTSVVFWDNVENTTSLGFYNAERSGNTIVGCNSPDSPTCNDTVEREAKWTGKVVIPYASDMGFATDGGEGITRSECWNLNIAQVDYQIPFYDDRCFEKNWFTSIDAYAEDQLWTLDPVTRLDYLYGARTVLHMSSNNSTSELTTHSSHAAWNRSVLPTLYLDENVRIVDGLGSQISPFVLDM